MGFSKPLEDSFDLGKRLLGDVKVFGESWADSSLPVAAMFAGLAVVLFAVGVRKAK